MAAQTPASIEIRLLLIASVFLAVNLATLALVRGALSAAEILPFAAWIGCAAVGELWLNRAAPRRDPFLFPLIMFTSGWGLIAIERLAPPFAERQTLWLIISTVALGLVVTLRNILRLLRAYRYTLLVAGLILLGTTIFFGVNPSGQAGAPRLWIGWQTFFFQPSELLKIILVAFLASYLAEQYPSLRGSGFTQAGVLSRLSPRLFGPVLLMWSVSLVLLIWQRDLGAAVLFFSLFLILLYVASGSLVPVLGGGTLLLIASVAGYHFIDLVRLRIDIWIDPWADASGSAYQIVQSLMAFGAGGVFGQGIAQGAPGYVPVVHSDFMFAALAEEWGFLGILTVCASLLVVTLRGLRIALSNTGRAFHALLAVGLSAIIGVQSLLIMGGVLKLFPLTGVTLPFFSYGGSSLLVNFLLVGLLLRVSNGEPA